MNIKNNITHVSQTLPAGCTLVAVSKTQTIERIQEAYDGGHRTFGENKVQELTQKYEVLPKDIAWHLIGHLQSNKVKYVAPFVSLIQSVDSLKLLEEIDKQGKKVNRVIHCLLQVHIAREETKFGFTENEIEQLLQLPALRQLANITIDGLMGMATFTDNADQVRSEFRGLKAFFDKLKASPLPANVQMKELSMGMSGDFRIAVEEGSTMVRVGSAIFGERNSMSLN